MNNQLVRTFVFETDEDVQRFMIYMRAHRKPMLEQGRFLQAVVSEYKPSRSKAQNAFMWKALLEPISLQATVCGQRYVSAVWNEHCKELFLPEVNAKGMQKWFTVPPDPRTARLLQAAPQPERRLAMSTSDLNTDEMAVYLDQVADYAVHELGVQLPANPREYDFGEAEARSSRRKEKE